jgi:CRISPR-associated protein Cmr4
VPLSEYWTDRMRRHLAIVDDEAFRHYVLTKTDIRTRIRVEEGRVMKGALWTEENLPMDTVMYAVLAASQGCGPKLTAFCESIKLQTRPVLQLGGDQNLGRGMMRICRLGA